MPTKASSIDTAGDKPDGKPSNKPESKAEDKTDDRTAGSGKPAKPKGTGERADEAPSNRRMIHGTNNGQPDALDPGENGDAYNP